MVGSRDGYYVLQIETGRILWTCVVVVVRVASGRGVKNGSHARLVQTAHGIHQRLGEPDPPPTIVGHHHIVSQNVLHIVEVVEAFDGAGDVTAALRIEKFARQNPNRVIDTYNADLVIALGADSPCHVGAVTMVIHGIATPDDDINAVDIVDVAVPVVVDTITRDLARIGPHVGSQVVVAIVHASIDNTYDHGGGAGG